MPSLSIVRSSNASYHPSFIPVFVAIGGTSGIGQEMVRAFANYTKGRAHFVIVGRNRQAAETTLAGLPIPSPSQEDGVQKFQREFLYCDVQLMKNVHAACRELLTIVPKINYLILSAGVFAFSGFEPTEEGIDKKLASRYYSRWVFTYDLLPALRKARELGEPAGMMSVLAGGMGPTADLDDLGLTKNWGGLKAMLTSGTYTDLMVSEFAKREPDIAFTHIYPGFVKTGFGVGDSSSAKAFFFLITPLVWFFAVKVEVCAEYMLYALLDNQKGMSLRNEHGDEATPKHNHKGDEAPKRLWEHSGQVTGTFV